MKKLFCILMCLAILAASVVVSGATNTGASLGATNGTCSDNLKWNYDSSTKTLTISGNGPMEEFEIQEAPWIKNDLNIYNLIIEEGVTSIGERAFIETSVKEVSLPTTLTSIGSNAFWSCGYLKEVTLPENLTKIGSSAFGYTCLESIIIPKSVIKVENYAFEECENMTDITFLNPECEIYNNIGTIYETTTIYGAENSTAQAYAEKYNRNFIKIDIAPSKPAGNCGENVNWEFDADTATLTISGSGAMADYDYNTNPTPWSIYEIEKVVIADGVTTIGNSAFADLVNLTEISIPDSVTSIGTYAFRECESLKNITLPDTITSLGEGAFCGCRGFESFTIPSSVTTLNEAVLAACQSLESIYIHSNITQIHKNAFQGSASVKQIEVDPENPVYDSRDNCNSIIVTNSNVLFLGCKSTTIPTSVTAIDDDAFDIDFGPSDIVIPGNVKTIGKTAFQACRANTITIHEGVEVIDEYAFTTAQGPTTIVLPKSLTYIGYCAFGYSTITDITILNPECEIFDHPYTLPNLQNSVIRGAKDSTAQQYAEKYNRIFEVYVEQEFELGDVDKDGVVSVMDATEIQLVISKHKNFVDDTASKLADVDKDGEISVMDATAIQMKIAKIE